MKVFILATIAALLFLSSTSLAIPFLHDYQPSNNTFLGGGVKTISVNITDDNLNASSVSLHIISLNAYDQGDNWDVHALSCVNATTEWKCSKNLSFAIAGSDTVELFYFDANDTDGVTGNNGTVTSHLRFVLDRNPPAISFTDPANNSYVSRNKTLSISVTDASSGVDNNTVQYSTDNSTWTTMKNVSLSSFESVWNTTVFSNNQTVTLYAKASDNIGNNFSANINVTVDNEIPDIKIISPLPTSFRNSVQLEVNVSDYYSGVDLSNVKYIIDGLGGILGCTGNKQNATCSALMSTVSLSDGNHTFIFTVTDNAGNSKNASVEIKIVNTLSISIIEPSNNDFIKGTTLVRTTLVNTENAVKYAEISIEQGGSTTVKNMTCDANFTSCNYSLDTTAFADGGYTIKTKAINSLNFDVSSSITVNIDNKKPSLSITQPTGDVKGDFEIKANVAEANLVLNKIMFNISSFNGSLACTLQTPSTFICSTIFNSKQLSDGKYVLNVSAQDKAGNLVVESKEVTIINQQTASSGQVNTSSGQNESGAVNKTQTGEGQKTGGISFPIISISFKGEYIMIGVIATTVIVVIIILSIIVIHRAGKTIITDQ